MKFNPEIYEIIKDINSRDISYYVRYEEVLTVLFQVNYCKEVPDLMNLVKQDTKLWDVLCMKFLDYDLSSDRYVLKVDLFEEPKLEGSYKNLCDIIKSKNCMSNRGHLNNPQDYEVYLGTRDRGSQVLFDSFIIDDLDKAADVIIEYYQTAKPAKKLSGFLAGGFLVNYEST